MHTQSTRVKDLVPGQMFKDPEYDDNIFTVEALVAEGQFIIVQCFLDFGLFREPVRTKFDLIYGSRNRVTVVE